ncbi:MAG: GNAT family N-acetyltransferase [Clostridia bacterium]|nr:GNAT family N-acetyltransferase [Clostridia bacterium]
MITFKIGKNPLYEKLYFEVFGDREEFISQICDTSTVVSVYDGDAFCGGACLFDVSVNGFSGAYLYAVCVNTNMRGKGYASALINYIKEYCVKGGYSFILTVPAEKGLFSYYKRLGFTNICYGAISLTGESTQIITPCDVYFEDFDGDFQRLYGLHLENDTIIKPFTVFKLSLDGLNVKYAFSDTASGYCVFKGEECVFASISGTAYKACEKALVMITDENFVFPNGTLCDLLFEI